MPKVIINRFDKGMTNQNRNAPHGASRIIRHFDILTETGKLSPFRAMEDDGAGDTEQLVKFLLAGDGIQYALGVVSGSGKAKVFERTSQPDGAWTESTSGADSAGARSSVVFVDYKGVLYGWSAGNRVWSYNYATNTFTSSARSITYTSLAQGLVHSKDDILYLPYYDSASGVSAIASNNDGTWNNTAITLPTDKIITSIAEYGNFLAIGAKDANGLGKSIVYLWDRDSTLETLSESIDWGISENLELLFEYEGMLIGISSTTASSTVITPKVFFKYYSGTGAKKFKEFTCSNISQYFGGWQKADGRILFMMSIEVDSVGLNGIWGLGKDADDQLSVYIDTLLKNDSIPTPYTLYQPQGFQLLGNYMTVSFIDPSDTFYYTYRTNDQSVLTASSEFWTTINPRMPLVDTTKQKTLEAVAIHFEYLPSGGSVKLEYRVDNGSWTEIFTHTTASTVVKEDTKDVNGSSFKSGREYEFKITSTGGAEITGLDYKYDTLKSQI